jgi:hypothetical protein
MKNLEKNLKYIAYFLLLAIFFILIFNITYYHPILGYDGEAHDAYIDHLSRYLPNSLNMPLEENTREFFSPPLAYFFPSVVQVICRNTIKAVNLLEECKPYYNKATQIFQAALYFLTLLISMKTINLYLGKKKLINLNYLLLASLLAVNYRTISMIRGEVYILFFMSLLLNRFLKLKINNYQYSKKDIIVFGLIIGFLGLSRQWAFLLFPSLFLLFFLISKDHRKKYFNFLFGSFLIGFVVSAWFYFNLFFEYGSFTSFNKESLGFNLNNQKLSFYLPVSNELSYLFTKPIRPYFSNQFLPILYADVWGDYWGYFVFTSRFLDIGRNQLLIGDYLARVNILSLLPTLLILFGFYRYTTKHKKDMFIRNLSLSVMVTFFGYLWFVVSYPEIPSGDTIKATYMVQLFNLIIIPASLWLDSIKKHNLKRYSVYVFSLALVFIHNFSSYLSHFPLEYIQSL